ncbi:MAG: hypothetical protein ABH950_03855 [Candidatus Altiarchaeota archaeon]
MKASDIWFRFVAQKKRIVSSEELRLLCQEIGRPYNQTVNYLQRRGYLVRVLRGWFYVKSPEEVKLKVLRENSMHLIAETLEKKGVKRWYFALESALKLNNMTHEYFTVGQVITDAYKTPRPIWVVDRKYTFLKWSRRLHGFGIMKTGKIPYSDPEKTILDLCYRGMNLKMDPKTVRDIFDEYEESLNHKRIQIYLKHYPKRLSHVVEGAV